MGIKISNLAKKIDKYVNNKIKFWYCILGFVFMFTLWLFSSQSHRPTVVFFAIPFLILFILAYLLTKSIIKSILIGIVLAFFVLLVLIMIALGGGH